MTVLECIFDDNYVKKNIYISPQHPWTL